MVGSDAPAARAPRRSAARPAGAPPAGARAAAPLQRQIGNRAFAALVARDPAPSFSGNVFLPGDENVGHSFTRRGHEHRRGHRQGQADRRDGRRRGPLHAPRRQGRRDRRRRGQRPRPGRLGQPEGRQDARHHRDDRQRQLLLWDADGAKHDFTVKNGGVYTKAGKKRRSWWATSTSSGRYRVKLGGAGGHRLAHRPRRRGPRRRAQAHRRTRRPPTSCRSGTTRSRRASSSCPRASSRSRTGR